MRVGITTTPKVHVITIEKIKKRIREGGLSVLVVTM